MSKLNRKLGSKMPTFFVMKYAQRTEGLLKFNNTKAELIRCIREDRSIYYIIRVNRKVNYKTNLYDIALKYFAGTCTLIIRQLKIY